MKAKAEGKTRFVGFSGYPLSEFKALLERIDARNKEIETEISQGKADHTQLIQIDVVLSYCRYTLQDNTLAEYIPHFIHERRLALINAAPMSMGLLSKAGPAFWHPATDLIKSTCQNAVEYCESKGCMIDLFSLYS
jgi:L-galactose dehydrogenase